MSSARDFEGYTAMEILQYAVAQYDDSITLASSFGAEDVVLIDMLSQIKPDIDIFFLDTALHFQETYETIHRLEEKYQRTFTRVKSKWTLAEQEQQYGAELWRSDPDLCCHLRKVQPLQSYLHGFDAWITGIRREQSPTRGKAQKVEHDARFCLMKFNPIVDWTEKMVWSYILERQVPYNPLHDQNYPSIGCAVCTSPVVAGTDKRSGRWGGFAKTECGLHQ